MSDEGWNDAAELLQAAVQGKGWGGGRAPARVMKGSVRDIVRYLRDQNIEDIWRFAILTEDGRHIRSAELRTLLRSFPAA